jgi:hypothetical protein
MEEVNKEATSMTDDNKPQHIDESLYSRQL